MEDAFDSIRPSHGDSIQIWNVNEFRDELPKTLVEKVVYRILGKEGNKKCS